MLLIISRAVPEFYIDWYVKTSPLYFKTHSVNGYVGCYLEGASGDKRQLPARGIQLGNISLDILPNTL